MTLVLLEKGLVLEGSTPKIEDKQVPGIYTFTQIGSRYSIPQKYTTYIVLATLDDEPMATDPTGCKGTFRFNSIDKWLVVSSAGH